MAGPSGGASAAEVFTVAGVVSGFVSFLRRRGTRCGFKPKRIRVSVHLEEKLKAERIQLLLRSLPGWMVVRGGTAISRSYALPSHRAAISFALFVNELAADHGLTADLDLRPNRVTVTLVSRQARGLTQAEFDLAKAIDSRD